MATSVAKAATFCSAEYSSTLCSSSVRTSEVSRSEQNLCEMIGGEDTSASLSSVPQGLALDEGNILEMLQEG